MKKTGTIILCVLVLCGMLVGCGSGGGSGESYTIGINQFGDHASLDNCREGFLEGLRMEGIVEGENLTIEYQNAQFDSGTANLIAQSQVSNNVDLICAIATPSAQASYNAADGKDIPVVFTAVTDPVAAGLTGGNVTGTSDKLPVEAQLKLIRALMPEATKVGILYTLSEVNSESAIADYEALTPQYGFEIVTQGVSASGDIPLAMDSLISKVDVMTNLTDNTVVGSLSVLLDKANAKGVPIFGSEIEQVKLGCVAAEGIEYYQLGIQTGQMAAKVLKGQMTAEEIDYEIIKESSLYINEEVMADFGLELTPEYAERVNSVKNE